MKASLLLTTFLAIFCLNASGMYSLQINNPQKWNSATQGIITNPELKITPRGIYAEVEMIFELNAQTTYSVTDTLEAVLQFDLPANSLIHDSWLWLDNIHIIVADVVEKNRAISIYEGIVKRRRDPSLLIKTGANSYQLNVFPLTTNYPRKVKIVYSVPMNWQKDKVNFPIPVEIFKTSKTLPDITAQIGFDGVFGNPAFTDKTFSNYILGSNSVSHTVSIPAAEYKTDEFYLNYQTTISGGIYLNKHALNANEGIYQLVVTPQAYGSNTGRNFNFILDYDLFAKSVYSTAQIKAFVRSFLINNLTASDSFNIFYPENGAVKQAFTTWQSADPATIAQLGTNVLASVDNSNQFAALMKAGIVFSEGKDNAQTIVISNNATYSNSQASADALYNSILTQIGGSFKNPVYVINNGLLSQYIYSPTQMQANEIFYSKLCVQSGGDHYKTTSSTYTWTNGTGYVYTYNFDVTNILGRLGILCGATTSSHNIDIDIPGGFTYATYNVNGSNRLNTSVPFLQTGKYYGTIPSTPNIKVQATLPGTVINTQPAAATVYAAGDNNRKAWTYHYINSLDPFFITEIIDSSIKNRVLCTYTAFLAVETGDTLQTNLNNNSPVSTEDIKKEESFALKCYPNPFAYELTIEWSDDISMIEIYDMTGRLVYRQKVENGARKLNWNGKDGSGNNLPAGVYMVLAHTGDGQKASLKLTKL